MPLRDTTGGTLAESRQNQAAARIFREIRSRLKMTQPDFADELARRAGVADYSQPAMTGWEHGTRTVPSPLLFAALEMLFESGVETSLEEFIAPYWVPMGSRFGRRSDTEDELVRAHRLLAQADEMVREIERRRQAPGHPTVASLQHPEGLAAIADAIPELLDTLEIPRDVSQDELLEIVRQMKSESTNG